VAFGFNPSRFDVFATDWKLPMMALFLLSSADNGCGDCDGRLGCAFSAPLVRGRFVSRVYEVVGTRDLVVFWMLQLPSLIVVLSPAFASMS